MKNKNGIKNKLLMLTSTSLLLMSNISTAGVIGDYLGNNSLSLKLYAGNTNDSYRYEAVKNGFDPGGVGVGQYGNSEFKKTNAVNLLTPGVGILFDRKLDSNVNLGLELSLQRQLDGYKFDQDIDNYEAQLLDGELYKVHIDNKLKSSLSAVLKLANTFYIKAGPSYMRQRLKSIVFQTNTPKKVVHLSKTHHLDLFGVNAGTGLVYNVTKTVSVFSEFNYTYFFKKDLTNFVYDPKHFPGNGAPNFYEQTMNEQKIKFSQMEYFVGVMMDLDIL